MSDKEQKKHDVCCQLLRDGPGTAWAGFDVFSVAIDADMGTIAQL